MGLMRRLLQATTLACLTIGIWRHDWTLIVASTALLAMWWLIGDRVLDPSLGTASSIPQPPTREASQTRGGEAAPNDDVSARIEMHGRFVANAADQIKDPELRAAFQRAHRAWGKAQ